MDRKLGSLLNGAVDALERLLKHSDWKARNAAIEKILRVHGKYVEKFDITDRREAPRLLQGELLAEGDEMSDEMRTKARELIALQRSMSSGDSRHDSSPNQRTRVTWPGIMA